MYVCVCVCIYIYKVAILTTLAQEPRFKDYFCIDRFMLPPINRITGAESDVSKTEVVFCAEGSLMHP